MAESDLKAQAYQLARSIGLKSGGILGIILGTLTILLYATDLFSNQIELFVTIPLMLGFMAWSMWQLRTKLAQTLTLGQGFRTGLTTAVMAALINAVLTQVYTSWLDPSAAERALLRSKERMLAAGESIERVNLYGQFMEQMSPPAIAIPAVIITVAFFGAIAALLLALIMKKSPK